MTALFSLIFGVIFSTNVMATVVVTQATGGTGISADKAANSITPGYTTLSVIKVTEGSPTDFAINQVNRTFILSAPSNYTFNPGHGSVTQVGTGFQNTATISVTSTTITVTFSTNASTTSTDALWISGIQVEAVDGSNLTTQNITRSGGTATINWPNNPNFGNMNSIAGALDHFSFATISSPQVAGANFSVAISAVDYVGNIRTNYNSNLNLTTNAGTITPASTGTGFVNGVRTLNVNVSLAGTLKTITATDPMTAKHGTSNTFTVNPNSFVKLQLLSPGESPAPGTLNGKTGTPSAQTASNSFNVTVNAVDADWNVVSSTDMVSLTSSDGDATLPAATALVAGTVSLPVTFNTCSATETILATDASNNSITSSNSPNITVNCPTPAITSLSTSCALVGDGDLILDIYGSDYVSSSLVIFHANTYTPVYISSTQLEVTIPASEFTSAATRNMHIKNPGNLVSSTVNFYVYNGPSVPVISTTAPNNSEIVTVCEGSGNVTFVATATGDGITYQWYNGSGPIANATSSSFTIYNDSLSAFDIYYVIVTGECANSDNNVTVSDTWLLIINPKPQFIVSETPTTCHTGQGPLITTTNGTITISPDDLGPNYSYSINGGTSFPQSDPNNYWDPIGMDSVSADIFTNLTAGNYTVVLQDDNGCLSDPYVEAVGQPDPISFVIVDGNPVTGQMAVGTTAPYVYESCFGYNDVHIYVLQSYQFGTPTQNANPYFDAIDSLPYGPIGGTPDAYGNYTISIDSGYTWVGYAEYDYAPLTYAHQYYVAAQDGNGCVSSIIPTLILQPTALDVSATQTNVDCYGNNNGSVTVTGSGGTTPYGYNISTNVNPYDFTNTSGIFSALAPGTYTFTVQDANGCQNTVDITITQPSAPLTSICSSSDIPCNTDNSGTVYDVASGGTPGYTYAWDNGTQPTAQSQSGQVAGTYNVTVTDANNCTTTCSLTIPGVLSATLNSTNISCYAGSNGTITVSSPTGGHSVYQYSIDGGTSWQNSGSYTGLPSGTYNVEMRDSLYSTCIDNINPALYLSQPAAPVSGSLTPSSYNCGYNISCNGLSNGSIGLAPAGGVGSGVGSNYSYNWSGPNSYTSSAQNPTGLAAGTYNVTITDANNCTGTTSITLTEPVVLAIAPTVDEPVSCNGFNNGSFQPTPSGGCAAIDYSFNWSPNIGSFCGQVCNGGSGPDEISNLTVGTYNITVTDDNGCTAVSSVVFDQPDSVHINSDTTQVLGSYRQFNISCNGAGDGILIFDLTTGGDGFYAYSLDGVPDFNSFSISEFDGLAAGTYILQAEDFNGCLSNIITTVLTDAAPMTADTASTNISCNGAANGTITVSNIAGGNTSNNYFNSYQYQSSIDGGTTWQNSGNYTNLAPGSYDVQIRDSVSRQVTYGDPQPIYCTTDLGTITITQPSVLMASSSAGTNALSCYGNTTTVTVSGSGGSPFAGPTYTGAGLNSNVGAGTYTYTITDSHGCQATTTQTITQPTQLAFVARGYNDYLFNVNPSADYYGTTVSVTCNGSTDAAVLIIDPSQMPGFDPSTDAPGGPTGGVGPYVISTDDGSTFPINGGQYTIFMPGYLNYGDNYIVVQDANGCTTAAQDIVITNPAAVGGSLTQSGTNNCYGDNSVEISASGSGGTNPYNYVLDSINNATPYYLDDETSGNFFNWGAGSYIVVVTDNNGCSTTLGPITVTQPDQLSGTISTTNITCNGANDGTITITGATGGTGTISFSIDGAGTFQSTSNQNFNVYGNPVTYTAVGMYSNLYPDIYDVWLGDANGCEVEIDDPINNTPITEPDQLVAGSTTSTEHNGYEVSCFGGSNGNATVVNTTGGTTPYTYLWSANSGNQTTNPATGLAAGTYTVTVTDFNGCTDVTTATLSAPSALSASVTVNNNVTCFGGSNGSINVSGSGGVPSYTGTGTVNNLTAGTYTYTITDQNGCNASNSATVTQPAAVTVTQGNLSQNNDNNNCSAVVSYSAATTGPGTISVSYVFTGATTGSGSGDGGGSTFNVGITTVNLTATSTSCGTGTTQFTVTVTDNQVPVITSCSNVTGNNDAGQCSKANVTYSASATDNCGVASYSYNPPSGSNSFNVGTNPVTVTVTDVNGNTATCSFNVTITDNEPPVMSCNNSNTTIYTSAGSCNQTGTYTAPSATDNCPGVGFIQTAGLASGVLYSAGVTTNTFLATDAHGNTSSCSFTITVNDNVPPIISCPGTATANADNGACLATGVSIGTATATDNCTASPSISNNHVSSSYPVGNTTVMWTAQDASGNTSTCNQVITITDNQAPVFTSCANISANADNGQCSAANVTYSATATDNCGVQGYSYNPPSGNNNFAVGTNPVTVTATDIHGNTASCSFNVTIVDNQPPVLSVPTNITVNNANNTCGNTVTFSFPTATDNCGGTLAQNQTFNYTGSTTTFTVPSGNSTVTVSGWGGGGGGGGGDGNHGGAGGGGAYATSVLSVNPGDVLTLYVGGGGGMGHGCVTGSGAGTAGFGYGSGGAGCNAGPSGCSGAGAGGGGGTAVLNSSNTVLLVAAGGGGGGGGANTTGCFGGAAGGGGASGSAGFGSCSGAGGSAGGSGNQNGTSATEISCDGGAGGGGGGGLHGGSNGISPSCSCGGNDYSGGGGGGGTSLGSTVTNGSGQTAGNSGACSGCGAGGNQGPNASNGFNGGNGVLIISYQVPYPIVTQTGGHVSGFTYPVGTTTNTYSAVDSHGNTSTSSFTVTVVDNQPPTITFCPSNVTYNADNNNCSKANVTLSGATATDNCSVNGITYSPVSGSTFNVGTSTVTVTATDVHTNTSTCSFTVTVVDNQAPIITSCANVTGNADNGSCSKANVTYSANATDNCGVASYSYSTPSGNNSFAVGTHPVTVTVTDVHGNTATCSFNVIITDTQVPVITSCANVTGNADNGACSKANVTYSATATDNCSVSSYSYSPPSGNNSFNVGTNPVSVTVTDVNGNTSTCSFNVTISDNQAPVISNCPSSFVADRSCPGSVSWSAATATDNCNVTSFTWAQTGATTGSGAGNVSSASFNIGVTTVTYTALDAAGNSSTCGFTVTVNQLTVSLASPTHTGYNISCFAGSDGAINSTVTNGNSITYSWSGPSFTSTSANISGLAVGTYTVTVSATGVCTVSATYTETQPAASVAANVTGTNLTCYQNASGIATSAPTGGVSGYTYNWSAPGGATPSITGLTIGAYTVTVTDANNCTATGSATLTQPTVLAVTGTVTNVTTCFYSQNGAVSISPTGGTTAYSFNWSGTYVNNSGSHSFSSTNQNISSLDSGVYTVTVTDANSCTVSLTKTVSSPNALRFAVQITNTFPCYNNTTGKITILATEGSSPSTPYNYSDNNGATFTSSPNFFANLTAGTYSVVVTDHNGCTSTNSSPNSPGVAVVGPSQPTITVGTVTKTSIQIIGGGGTPGYTYKLNGGAAGTTNVKTGLTCNTAYCCWQVLDSKTCQSPILNISTLACRDDNAGTIDQNSNTTLSVYPNPASDHVTVLFSADNEETYNLRFFDILGQLVQSYTGTTTVGDNQMEINLAAVAKGVYVVDLEHGATKGKIRVVVQ